MTAPHDTTHDLVIRALHFYNTGDGLTRAEVVDMAKRIESLEAAMLKAATAIDVLHEHDGKGWSISRMLRAAVAGVGGEVPAEPATHDTPRLVGKAKTNPATLYMDGTSPVTVMVQATTDELRALHNQTVTLAVAGMGGEAPASALRAAEADLSTARDLASEAAASGRFDKLLGHLLASVPPPTSRDEP